MKQKTICIYKINELNEQAKERVIENYRDINVNYDDWNEHILIQLVEDIKEKTNIDIEVKDIKYEMFSRSNCMYIESSLIVSEIISKYPQVEDFDLPKKFGVFTNYLGGGMCSGLKYSEYNTDYIEFEEIEEEENQLKNVVKQKTEKQKQEVIKGTSLDEIDYEKINL